MTTRTTVEDCELGGVFIPKDTKVDVDIYNLHRNPRVWSNPDEFIPDRYASGGEAERQPGSGLAWVPFRYILIDFELNDHADSLYSPMIIV